SQDKTRQSRTYNRTGHHRTYVHWPGVTIWRQHVGDEEVQKIIRGSHVSNRRIINGEADRAAETSWPVPAGGTIDPGSEIPRAVAVEGPGGCDQGRHMCSDHNVGQRNADAVELEDLTVRRPGLRVLKAGRKSRCDTDVRPILGDVYSAKRRRTTGSSAVI